MDQPAKSNHRLNEQGITISLDYHETLMAAAGSTVDSILTSTAESHRGQFFCVVVNLLGCPPNPVNFVGTLASYLLSGKLPELDGDGRPKFAYAKEVHGQCLYREDKSRCLFEGGCKGKKTHNNCPSVKFNDGTSFPMQAGHPCIGCSEPDFWDTMTPFYQKS